MKLWLYVRNHGGEVILMTTKDEIIDLESESACPKSNHNLKPRFGGKDGVADQGRQQ